ETRAARGEPIDRSTLDRLRRQVTRLTRLLNELLDASRLQEGRMTLDVEELDLVELIDEQVVTASARQTDLTLEMPARAPVRGDRARLGAVCFQLIDNAVRFTQPGVLIRVSLVEEGPSWCLRVVDEGPGIAPDQVRHLFQRTTVRPKEKQPAGLG